MSSVKGPSHGTEVMGGSDDVPTARSVVASARCKAKRGVLSLLRLLWARDMAGKLFMSSSNRIRSTCTGTKR